jgi:hypothetical protein
MIAALLGLGCHRDPTDPPKDRPVTTTTPTGRTGDTAIVTTPPPDTGTRPGVGDFPAACRVEEDNVLRFHCTATLSAPAPVRFDLVGGPEDPVRTFRDGNVTVDHDVLAWGLAPSTTYTWTATDETTGEQTVGVIHVDALPVELLDLTMTLNAPDPAKVGVDAIVFQTGCPAGHTVMVDRFGRVIWYQDVEKVVGAEVGFVNAFTFTDAQTVLLEVGKSVWIEYDLDGNLLRQGFLGSDFDDLVHHDLFEKDGIVYAIHSHTATKLGAETIIDGIYAFDAYGQVIDDFTNEDLYPYASSPWMIGGYWAGAFPGAIDFSHTNSVWVDDAGDLLVSFRHLHAFAKFQGGPGTDGYGTLLWTAVGSDQSVIWPESDFTLAGVDPTFSGQHDVHQSADGTLLLLDNGLPTDGPTRAVRYDLDEAAHTLTEIDSWSLGLTCPVQGSVRDLPNGDVLAVCAIYGDAKELQPQSDDVPVWEVTAKCKGVTSMNMVRAIPVDL